MIRLAGKVAVITGGAGGIGEAKARLFVREGASVVITALKEQEGQKVAAELKAMGGRVEFIGCDITRSEDMKRVVARRFSRPLPRRSPSPASSGPTMSLIPSSSGLPMKRP